MKFRWLRYYFFSHFEAVHIAAEVRKQVLHTMLANIGIDALERIVAKAKENQKTVGHYDYKPLAEWLDLNLAGWKRTPDRRMKG